VALLLKKVYKAVMIDDVKQAVGRLLFEASSLMLKSDINRISSETINIS